MQKAKERTPTIDHGTSKVVLILALFQVSALACEATSNVGLDRVDAGSDATTFSADTASTDTRSGEKDTSVGDSSTPPELLRVFLSTNTYRGDFAKDVSDAAKEADRICQVNADAEELGGQWMAWFSTPTSNAIDRLRGNGPWYGIDDSYEIEDRMMFKNRAMLQTGPLANIWSYANGTSNSIEREVWTGTTARGTASDAHCDNWTSSDRQIGGTRGTTYGQQFSGWTDVGRMSCQRYAYLYCFEQGK